ncbi:DNA cytosine methyltransferase [Zobellia barbeyronii]|uniref:DNA (cytosine-5-)-methyltransferase n=1 Tax=Zobellia barbeyronii TaxID=2748009 RepID=A0ABS5WJV3_9FLAO|nr:DNA (cytosine-5-)-methyltransferase [Zobellia barbeyronii]MBT2163650.1 DNA (cytosine-5-)-methyltransferase [Zobellia barbeyronii]
MKDFERKNKVISLFSGAGGMDIGFEMAGFKTAVAVEFDKSCCETLRTNKPEIPVIQGDISKITTENILDVANLKPTEPALVIGGPPCQSFSLAGKRMGMDDPRGMLVLQFIRVVRESLPVAFVMENVKGMVNWEGGKAMDAIMNEIAEPIIFEGKEYNYEISKTVLNSANYGASQLRERVFIVGNRLSKKFKFPEATHTSPQKLSTDLFGNKKKKYNTVWDAIGKLPPADEPSETALRISKTIKERIVKHGY